MSSLFSYDNPVMQFISKIFDLIILNLLFILTCIPLFTIGASLSALYQMCLGMIRNRDAYLVKGYFKAFAGSFKQATVIWLLLLAFAAFLGMDYYIINSQDTAVFAVIRPLLWVISALWLCMFIYVFPVVSYFVCSTKQALKNALLMTIGFLPYTVVLFAIHAFILFLSSVSVKTLATVIVISGICGFSVVAFTCSLILYRIFRKYTPEDQTDIAPQ